MKKIICLILILLLSLTLVGCGSAMDTVDNSIEESVSMFIEVENNVNYGYRYSVVCHKETKVMYVLDHYNHFTVMVDAEGNPLLYSDDLY